MEQTAVKSRKRKNLKELMFSQKIQIVWENDKTSSIKHSL